MILCSFTARGLLLLVLLVFGISSNNQNTVAHAAKDHDGEYVMRWSSTGGGWRAMMACMGYANAFQQAGLFRGGESKFSAIAVNSGAAWFATQLFYSEAFYQQTMNVPPEELYDFVVLWMDAYLDLLNRVTNTTSTASLDDITNTSALDGGDDSTMTGEDDEASDTNVYLEEFFALFDAFEGDWAYFIQQNLMLNAAANAYGHDNNGGPMRFVDLPANGRNRIGVLNTTELLIQAALAPTARHRTPPSNETETETDDDGGGLLGVLFGEEVKDTMLYLGPVDKTNEAVYSVALSAAYIVNNTFNNFQYSTFDSGDAGSVAIYQGMTSPTFDFADWEAYYLYDSLDIPTVFVTELEGLTQHPNQTLMKQPFSKRGGLGFGPPPFGGGGPPPQGGQGGGGGMPPPPQGGGGGQGQGPPPGGQFPGVGPPPPGGPPGGGKGGRAATVTQVAAISSAAVGTGSPAIPSVFAQTWSRAQSGMDGSGLAQQIAFQAAVASMYEAPSLDNIAVCGQWPNPCDDVSDGWFIDGGFADNPSFAINIAQYHQSANADITKPMKIVLTQTNQVLNATYTLTQTTQYFQTDFNEGVPPGEYVWVPETHVPRRSPQVFGDQLDSATLLEMQQQFDDSNMTWCILEGTTIDNPAFGIRAGQPVEILLLHLNTPITTFIAGQTVIQETTIPLAEMTSHIASHQQLIQVVQDFFYPNGIPEDDEEEATMTATDGGEGDTTATSKSEGGEEGEEGEATDSTGGGPTQLESSDSVSHHYLQNSLVALTMLFSFVFSLLVTI